MDDSKRPIRLLSLDGGGGVRGLSELFILQILLARLNERRRASDKVEPWQLFDMIGGTGTGGFIAIMLGRLRMSIEECIHAYVDYSKEIVQPKRATWNAILKPRPPSTLDSKAMRYITRRRGLSSASVDDLMLDPDSPCKVFVVASSRADASIPLLLRSYHNRSSLRSEVDASISEAARATTASATFFEPFSAKDEDSAFDLSPTRHQNPLELVHEEAGSLWPRRDLLLVSIGAGDPPRNEFSGRLGASIRAIQRISDDAEEIAHNFEREHAGTSFHTAFFRFNALWSLADVDLEEYEALDRIEAKTRMYLGRPEIQDRLRRCVNGLSKINYEGKSVAIKNLELQRAEEIEFRRLANWLSPLDMSPIQSDVIAKLQEGTGTSLLQSSTFQSWLHGEIPTLLCLGGPGTGKTVLVAQVIDLITKHEGLKGAPVLYFFADQRTQQAGQQTPVSILAVLLRQLILSSRSISDETHVYCERHIGVGNRPEAQGLIACLVRDTGEAPRVFVVIDALDELSELCRRDLMNFLHLLQGKREISLMATSRPSPQTITMFEVIFRTYEILDIHHTQDDVEAFLLGQMSRLPDVVMRSTNLQEYIKDKIMRRSGGVFLIAKLLLDSLVPLLTVRQIKSALSSMPGALHDMYAGILGQIKDQRQSSRYLAFRILSWLTYVRRPITALELQHALAVEKDRGSLDEENLVDVEGLISVCGGLVVVTADRNFITFVHITAAEFFQGFRTTDFADGQRDIATTCLTYLCFDSFGVGRCSSDEDLQRRLRDYPFLDYAAHFWGAHTQEAPEEGAVMDAAGKLLTHEGKVSCCSQVMLLPNSSPPYSSEASPKGVTGLHLVAHFGLTKLARRLLHLGSDIRARDSDGRDPMSWAVGSNQTGIIPSLLKFGAEIDTRDNKGRTHLAVAAMNGHAGVVSMLLTDGADASIPNHLGQTPLSLAATCGHVEVLGILAIEFESNMNSKDKFGRTPLLCAAEQGHGDVVNFLMKNFEVDVNALDKRGQTPLMAAAKRGQTEVVKILLGHPDIQVNLQDGLGRTALAWAAIEGQLDVVQLLMARDDAGEMLTKADYSGRTAVDWAGIGNRELTRILLQSGDTEFRSDDVVS